MSAERFISEYSNPLFRSGNIVATPNLLIRESLALRVYDLNTLVAVDHSKYSSTQYLGCSLLFGDGSEIRFLSESDELAPYAHDVLDNWYRIDNPYEAEYTFDDIRRNNDEIHARNAKKKKTARFILIYLPTVALVFSMIVIGIYTQIKAEKYHQNFQEDYAYYEEVVQLFQSGAIDFGGEQIGSMPLPKEYARLSRGGRIRFEVTEVGVYVLFYQKLGIAGDFACYVYCDDSSHEAKALVGREIAFGVALRQKNWYYINTAFWD
jgi:hypothetical protein